MAYVITEPCLGVCDVSCVKVCPVDCIAGPKDVREIEDIPEAKRKTVLAKVQMFIDPDTCIDCGACIPECPYEAIFIQEEVPTAYTMAAGQKRIPFDTKEEVEYAGGEVFDLTADIQPNYDFFASGPGYDAL